MGSPRRRLLQQSRTKLQTDSGEQDDADVDNNANDDGEDHDREATVTTSKWFTERVNADLARELEAIDGKVCHFRLDGTTIPVEKFMWSELISEKTAKHPPRRWTIPEWCESLTCV